MGIRNVFVMMAVVLALVAGLACGGDDNRAEKAETLDITGTAQARAAAAAAPAAAAPEGVPSVIPAAFRAQVMEGDRVEEMNNMRAKIAEHMVFSKAISPHVGTVWELDFSRVAQLRRKHKAKWAERHGVNLTYTAFIMKAISSIASLRRSRSMMKQ